MYINNLKKKLQYLCKIWYIILYIVYYHTANKIYLSKKKILDKFWIILDNFG